MGSVGLWTLRVALAARGSRGLGSTIAVAEAMVFVVAFSHVTGSLDAPLQVLIYGTGVGTGTYVGVTVDRRVQSHGFGQRSIRSSEPGEKSHSPAGVSNAHMISPGER